MLPLWDKEYGEMGERYEREMNFGRASEFTLSTPHLYVCTHRTHNMKSGSDYIREARFTEPFSVMVDGVKKYRAKCLTPNCQYKQFRTHCIGYIQVENKRFWKADLMSNVKRHCQGHDERVGDAANRIEQKRLVPDDAPTKRQWLQMRRAQRLPYRQWPPAVARPVSASVSVPLPGMSVFDECRECNDSANGGVAHSHADQYCYYAVVKLPVYS